jgi:DNA-binding transcriptional MerR regulator
LDKAPDAFRTISEVADDLKVPQHVLRFWESRFNQIKPMKRAGGRRYYRPDDVDLLRGIHHLLYGEGYTIRGVQRILRDQGLKFVQTVWQPGAEQPAHPPAGDLDDAGPEDGEEREEAPRAAAAQAVAAPQPAWSREDLRRLQAALFELSECRRLLDAALVRPCGEVTPVP